jgi:putative nucleotidyltransferase with HDIG domain
MNYLWEHSISVAVFAKELSSYLKIEKEGAYLAGLLHDIGKLVIYFHDADAYEKIIKKVDEKGENFMILEEEVLNFSHIDAGNYLVNKWNLPEFIKKTILFHHFFISYAGDEPVIGIVAFANQLVHKYLDRNPVLLDIYLREYSLSEEELDSFAEKTLGIIAKCHLTLALEPPGKNKILPGTSRAKNTKLPGVEEGKSFADISSNSFSKIEDTIQSARENIKVEKGVKYRLEPGFGKPTIEIKEEWEIPGLEKTSPPPESQNDVIPEVSEDIFSDGVKLFLQLEKIKKELFELRKVYYLFDYVPLEVLQNHGEILKLFSESIKILLKDPKMSSKLNLTKIAKKMATKKPADKKILKKNN